MRLRSESESFSDRAQVSFRDYRSADGYVRYDITTIEECNFLAPGNPARWVSRSMEDVVTPGFHKIRKAGGIINNPMTSEMHSVQLHKAPRSYNLDFVSNMGHYIKRKTGTWIYSENQLPLIAVPSWVDHSDWVDQAVTQAWSRASIAEVQGLVSAGEMNETVSSLFSIARRLIKVAKAIKRLDANALKKEFTAKELADRYMELRYSLRPLVGEISGTYKAIKTLGNVNKRLTFRGAKTDLFSDTETVTNDSSTWYVYGAHQVVDYERTINMSVKVRAGVLCETWADDLIAKFGLLDIPESMWELVPFSFVVDWFFNIGQKIAAFSYNYGLTALASWVTVERVALRNTRVKEIRWEGDWPGNTTVETCPCAQTALSVYRERVPNPELSALPSFNLNLDAFKLLDLVIMGRNLFSSLNHHPRRSKTAPSAVLDLSRIGGPLI